MSMSKKSSYWETLPKCLKFLRHNSENTKRGYFQTIAKYEEFHNMTIEELVSEAVDEQINGVPFHTLKIIERIEDFQEELISQGLLIGTIKIHMGKIKSIYNKNRIEIPYIEPVNPKLAKRRQYIEYKDVLTKDEIKLALKHMSIRSQARALTMVQGGLSNEECNHLSTHTFIDELSEYHQCSDDIDALKWLSDENHPVIWVTKLIRQKTKKPYYAVIGCEAINKIAEAKLFEFDRMGGIPEKLLSEHKDSFARICRNVNKKCGFGTVAEESKFKAHNLRRFHATHIRGSALTHGEKSMLSLQEVDELQGRGKTSVQDTYMKSDPLKLKLLYSKVMNNVMLFNEYEWHFVGNDVVVSLKDVRLENEKLREEVKELSNLIQKKKQASEKVDALREELGDEVFKEMISGILNAS